MGNAGRVAASKHAESAHKRQDTILNAALRVLAHAGFGAAKMDQIAAAADLSKAWPNFYFPSKNSLLHGIERYALLPELPEMMASLGDTPPALGIPTLIAEIWRLLRQRKQLVHAISCEIQSDAKHAKPLAEQIDLPSYHSLTSYLDRWMNGGVCQLVEK